ncbi:MAG: hypothetical protein WDM84_06710 [Bauldia sp.]
MGSEPLARIVGLAVTGQAVDDVVSGGGDMALEQGLEDMTALGGEAQALAPADGLGVDQRVGRAAGVVVIAMFEDGALLGHGGTSSICRRRDEGVRGGLSRTAFRITI